MSALPQVFATDDELAASDALRDTASLQSLYQHTQQQPQPQAYSPSHTLQQQYSPSRTQQLQQQQQQQYSPSHSQSLHRTSSPFQQTARSSLGSSVYSPQQSLQSQQTQRSNPYQLPISPHSDRYVQRPQTGIASVPKAAQSSWQSVSSRGAYQYEGNTYRAALQSHMLTVTPASGHADGPQHLDNAAELETLPDAPHRQAWSNQPTFRWFKRHAYDDVPDRWAKKEGLKGRVRPQNACTRAGHGGQRRVPCAVSSSWLISLVPSADCLPARRLVREITLIVR